MVEAGAQRAGRSLDDLTLFSRCDTCVSEDHDLAYDSVRNNVAIFLWCSYPDRKFVHRVGLEVPKELEEVIARRDYELMLDNAHLVPDAFVDKLTWAGTPGEVAEKIARVVDMGIDHITIAPAPMKGGTIRDTVVACGEKVKPMVQALLQG
jgi:alkanesulfonate monooxygenase SsuD/methylene tetrahydromethanopterin reductase-like flavin-dependent oxidoreductase (luciferase family)